MLGTGLGYVLRHPLRAARSVLTDPVQAWFTFKDRDADLRERHRPQCRYEVDADWQPHLHDCLAVPWPCQEVAEFWALWAKVIESLRARGLRVGPESFDSWNDGDAGLVRAIWCLTRHLRPNNVVETGVARGLTSRFILEALERNGSGYLWSIDLPTRNPVLQNQIGVAVKDLSTNRWSYIRGSSRRRLPGLLGKLGQIDLFVHDSLHTEHNVRFELDLAWKHLDPRGVLVVDDIDANWGFQSFTQTFSGHRSMSCEAEPLYPDTRRFNQKGLFGIIAKTRPLRGQAPKVRA